MKMLVEKTLFVDVPFSFFLCNDGQEFEQYIDWFVDNIFDEWERWYYKVTQLYDGEYTSGNLDEYFKQFGETSGNVSYISGEEEPILLFTIMVLIAAKNQPQEDEEGIGQVVDYET